MSNLICALLLQCSDAYYYYRLNTLLHIRGAYMVLLHQLFESGIHKCSNFCLLFFPFLVFR